MVVNPSRWGQLEFSYFLNVGVFPLTTPSKESPRGDEQDAVQLVFLHGFCAENDGDQFAVLTCMDGLTGRSCPSCGAYEARADSIDGKVNKKNTGKRAPFQVRLHII